jgi:ankyrin repeat protein
MTVDKNSSMAIVSHVDLEGWTLLHVSASHGSFRVIPLLLEAGANPHALSMPTADDTVCTEVASRQVTPLDLVRAHYGSEGLKRFEEELRKAGLDTQYKDGDVFWSMDNALNKI